MRKKGNFLVNAIIVIIVIVSTLVIIRLTNFRIVLVNNSFSNFFQSMLSPIQDSISSTLSKVQNSLLAVVEFEKVKDENSNLKQQIAKQQYLINDLEEERLQNIRLKELLNYKNSIGVNYTVQAAEVIAYNPNNWDENIIINLGSKDKIKVGMPIINHLGYIGRVSSVGYNRAEITLINNKDGSVASMVRDSRYMGILEYSPNSSNELLMRYIPIDADLKKNDTVVSSGLGGLVPKGLLLGEIKSFYVEADGLTQTAVIETFADLRRLEEVLIITSFGGENTND
ncbi:MAG: rod shape-determining protein MreC [Clostridia bacterium]